MLASVFIFFVILALPFAYCELRRSKFIVFSYCFVIALHQAVAIINAFIFTTIGADADAITFNRNAGELAVSHDFYFSIGSKFYENMLGIFYLLFGYSHFLGEQLSILAFALSCIVLIKIMKQLNLLKYQGISLIFFGALPTMVLLGSVTLRESYQVLFFMLAVFFGIKMQIRGGLNRNYIFFGLSALVMGLFHNGLIVYMLFLGVLFLAFPLRKSTSLWRIKKSHFLLFVLLPVSLAGLSAVVKLQIPGTDALSALGSMDTLDYSSSYRGRSSISRATYGVELDHASFFSFVSSAFILYIYYLFAPFPWQVSNILDMYAAMESIIRLILIYYSIKHWRSAFGVQKRLLSLMLILFFSMSFLWALGTTNYGTAMRHHMLTWWILVIMGLPPLLSRLRLLSYSKPNQRPLRFS